VLHAVIQFVEKKSLQFLIPLPHRDIARHLGGTDHIASAIPDGRHRERNVDPATFLGESDGIEMIDPFTAAQSSENVVLFSVKLYGNDALDRLADHLLRLVAEDSRRARVPGSYAPVERLADDGVFRGSDYRGKAGGFDISRLAIGALDQEIDRAGDLTGRIPQQARIREEENTAAVRALQHRFDRFERPAFPQAGGHAAFVGAHRSTVQPIQSP